MTKAECPGVEEGTFGVKVGDIGQGRGPKDQRSGHRDELIRVVRAEGCERPRPGGGGRS